MSNTLRSQSEVATLEDAQSMLQAATDDPEVSKKLGAKALTALGDEIAEAKALLAQGAEAKNTKEDAARHAIGTAAKLLVVMQEIRDAVELSGSDAGVQKTFGKG